MTRKILIKFPDPHSNKQDLIMSAFKSRILTEIWVCCGTKFGKTLSASVGICGGFLRWPQTYYRWIAPIYEQSLIGYKYAKRLLPKNEKLFKFRDNEPSIEVTTNHSSRLRFYHGQDPYSLEGEAVNGYVLDEAAKMKKQVYDSSLTTVTQTRGIIMGVSTPLGPGWFKDRCDEAKHEMETALRQGRMPRMIFIRARTEDNPFVPRESILRARQTLPDRLFRQYYLAEFLSNGSVFENLSHCYYTTYIDTPEKFTWIAPEPKSRRVVIGADWAKTTDYTVFTACDLDTRRVVGVKRFNKVSYPVQVQKLAAFCKLFKDVETVWHDKTGVGIALDDMLAETELPFRGVTFSNASKNQLVIKLMNATDTGCLELPYLSVLSTEMNELEVKTSLTGLPTYSAPSGRHDDAVFSLALANAAMIQHLDTDYAIMEL